MTQVPEVAPAAAAAPLPRPPAALGGAEMKDSAAEMSAINVLAAAAACFLMSLPLSPSLAADTRTPLPLTRGTALSSVHANWHASPGLCPGLSHGAPDHFCQWGKFV